MPIRRSLSIPVLALLLVVGLAGGAWIIRDTLRSGAGYRDAVAGGLAVRYDGFVTEGWSFGDDRPRAERVCADETRFARLLEPGERIRFSVDLGRDPVLVLSACAENGGRGELEVLASSSGSAPLSARMTLPHHSEWRRLEVDLSPLAGRSTRIELKSRGGRSLMLHEAYVRHLGREPAPWPVPEDPSDNGDNGDNGDRAATKAEKRPGLEGRPQILLISVDTLRHDMVDLLDTSEASETPNLARFAADGEVFTVHRPGASWTKPSHATLLTGYPGSIHRSDGNQAVPAELPRLPTRLREAGLATAGLVFDCVWLNPKFGFDVGFDRYRFVKWDTGQMVRSVVNWLGAHRDEPFFFFFHTYGPHSDFHRLPYESEGTRPVEVGERFDVERYGCRDAACASGLLERLGKGEIEPLPREGEILEFLYRRGVRDADRELGGLFQDLRDLGLYDDLLIILTSDHGELFLEHGETLHGTFWEPVLRVPMIVKWPLSEARAGRVTEIPTSAIDVVPTILATAGIQRGDLPGVDLRRPRPERPIFVGHQDWWVVYEGGYKAIIPDRGRRRLFYLPDDPDEARNLKHLEPEVFERFEQRLRGFQEWSRVTRDRLLPEDGETKQILTPEERERLRALGYLQ